MHTSIVVIWSVGLAVALGLTVVVLKLVILVVKTERDILRLARVTLPAAEGIVRNTALIGELGTTTSVAGQILGIAGAIEGVARSIRDHLWGLQTTMVGGSQ